MIMRSTARYGDSPLGRAPQDPSRPGPPDMAGNAAEMTRMASLAGDGPANPQRATPGHHAGDSPGVAEPSQRPLHRRARPARRIARADSPWRLWGPYLAGRQWGTVREDYSADGDAWSSFPFDQAYARAYRWGEDGLGGICDRHGFINFGLALWNGKDPILKERLFGLTNGEGNHGEDAKEYWWAIDGTPSHSWMQWLYRYPHEEFPYQQLRERERANAAVTSGSTSSATPGSSTTTSSSTC